MMKTVAAAIAVYLSLLVSGAAGIPNTVVAVRALAPEEPLKAGEAGELRIELSIPRPYHINSNTPLQKYLIPTQVELEPVKDATWGSIHYPEAEIKKLPVSDIPMAVYSGTIVIRAEIVPSAMMEGAQIAIKGRVRVQACDNRSCLPPVWQPFTLNATVIPAASLGPLASADPAAVANPGDTLSPPGRFVSPSLEAHSLGIVFFLVFLGGLALNLTPCVYPIIPITITYFGGQAGGRKGRMALHSFFYVIGMAITYSILGVFAAMTGGLFGAALQYPPVMIGISLIMVLLALSMFDVYEFRMPAALTRIAGSTPHGFAGSLIMGLTVGIVAAPCIGPFVLGLLTYVGNRGNVLLGFLLFFTLALGLGVPFLFLGFFSGSLSRLPRSGAWMVWVRKAFGFILLAMAAFFLQNLFSNPLIYPLSLSLLLLLAGIYLAWIESVPNAGKAFVFVRNLVGVLFFGAAVFFAANGIREAMETAPASQESVSVGSGIEWSAYSEDTLGRAARERRPVFIDFYADWCAPCKEMDAKTFAAPDVLALSRQFVMVKVDLTVTGHSVADTARERHRVQGVPTLVFLTPDGEEIKELRGTGFEPEALFLRKMNRALLLTAQTQVPD